MAMHAFTTVAASGAELIWLIIVLITIIAQLTKARKNMHDQGMPTQPAPDKKGVETPPRPQPGRRIPDPEDEIRKFLEELGKVAETPAEQPPAIPQQGQKQQSQRRKRPPPLIPLPPPTPVVIAPQQESVPAGQEAIPYPQFASLASVAPEAAPQYAPQTRQDKQQMAQSRGQRSSVIRASLKNRDSLRTAIVLREILGPPLSLRSVDAVDYLHR